MAVNKDINKNLMDILESSERSSNIDIFKVKNILKSERKTTIDAISNTSQVFSIHSKKN